MVDAVSFILLLSFFFLFSLSLFFFWRELYLKVCNVKFSYLFCKERQQIDMQRGERYWLMVAFASRSVTSSAVRDEAVGEAVAVAATFTAAAAGGTVR
jgi:hypothetical protein